MIYTTYWISKILHEMVQSCVYKVFNNNKLYCEACRSAITYVVSYASAFDFMRVYFSRIIKSIRL